MTDSLANLSAQGNAGAASGMWPDLCTTPSPVYQRWRKEEEERKQAAQPTRPKTASAIEAAREEIPSPDLTLVGDLAAFFSRYLHLQPGDDLVLAAWVLFTHTHDSHRHSPRLFLWSPTYGCGKSTALQMLELLVCNPFPAIYATEAIIFRAPTECNHPTMLFDEADTWLKEGSSPMIGLLNSGFGPRALAKVPRTNMDSPNHKIDIFSTWSPVVFASRGKKLKGGLVRRSIQISMMKASPSEEPQAFVPEEIAVELQSLMGRITSWAKPASVLLKGAKPLLPASLVNKDTWRPMFAIAELYNPECAERLRKLALEKECAGEVELNVQLLRDVGAIFEKSGKERLQSGVLCARLEEMEDGPWSEIMERAKTPQAKMKWLGAQLKPFGILPEREAWKDEKGMRGRGYSRATFEPVWEQYGITVNVPLPKRAPVGAKPPILLGEISEVTRIHG